MKLLLSLSLFFLTSCGPRSFIAPALPTPSSTTSTIKAPQHSEYPLVASPEYAAWKVWLALGGLVVAVCIASGYRAFPCFSSPKPKCGAPPQNVSLGAAQGKK
jgi:hypothetical protein